ncbi:hypothetical protein [Jeotgalibacillus proteolyticus]|uniref:Uncharacterized protein n=1 Tax=Jeotgalibacillus proteolyticus TaxID=2082395 RepID=A0A2S5GAU5_9BACL|nr:hypothetical protein [Jeotgalibacillus proteolyticus]PPA70045.1 hypothetical protein C4B60_10645 [Jeotgalibacillus proteolyticus]
MPKTDIDYLKSIDSTLKDVLKELKRGNPQPEPKRFGKVEIHSKDLADALIQLNESEERKKEMQCMARGTR